MEGLGRHYPSTAKKTVKGHSLFTSLYVLLGRRCPLQPQLYRQKAVCEREKVPFRSKVDLAQEVIRTFEPVSGTRTHVLMDSWYTCRRLWRLTLGRGWAITGGLKANRKLRVEVPEQGRVYLALSEYAAGLTDEDFEPVDWPHEDGSSRQVYAHLIKTFVRKLGPLANSPSVRPIGASRGSTSVSCSTGFRPTSRRATHPNKSTNSWLLSR